MSLLSILTNLLCPWWIKLLFLFFYLTFPKLLNGSISWFPQKILSSKNYNYNFKNNYVIAPIYTFDKLLNVKSAYFFPMMKPVLSDSIGKGGNWSLSDECVVMRDGNVRRIVVYRGQRVSRQTPVLTYLSHNVFRRLLFRPCIEV